MMDAPDTGLRLTAAGITRRGFLKYCATVASMFALPSSAAAALPQALRAAPRLPVLWLSFQECTGCTESLTRASAPSLERLLFDFVSLDYHHTLMAAAGDAAEAARQHTMTSQRGRYLLIVDGSVPATAGCSTIAGVDNLDMLAECAAGAVAVIATGTCAAFGGLPAAAPNPTAAQGVAALMEQQRIASRPLVNIPGCPPLPMAISGVLAHYLAFGRFPDLDGLARPLAFYGNTVHERCSRYHFYQQEKFAERFDDEGARKGWCLYKLGCKGPTTHNACASVKWNDGTSFPVEAGHPCLGCSEPGFWDHGGFYRPPGPPAAGAAAQAADGRTLFEENCTWCHSADPGRLRSAPDAVADLLRSGKVPAHRNLDFDPAQLDALEAWLRQRLD